MKEPSIIIGDISKRRFALIDRDIQKYKQEIMEQEDAATFAALDFVCNADDSTIFLNTASAPNDCDLVLPNSWDNITNKFLTNVDSSSNILNYSLCEVEVK